MQGEHIVAIKVIVADDQEVVRKGLASLLAADGIDNDEIARRLQTRREVVWLWRKRFYENRLSGLEERPRPGRPRAFPRRHDRAD